MSRKILNRILLAISLLALAGSALLLAIYWKRMPDQIPTHFDAAGQIDGWGAKSTVLLLPIIGTVMFGMLQFVAIICSSMKTVGSVRPMLAMETMCRLLNVLITLVFAYLTVCSAMSVPLGRWFMWAFIGSASIVMIPCIVWACIPQK